jgi:putative ABC transport system permease protein
MLFNYLKTAWRNLAKQKGYSLINLSGLAIGMACCILIFLFVQDELSYDRFHEKADQIHRLVIDAEIGGSYSRLAVAPFAAPPAFAEEIPEIESYVRIIRIGRQQIIKHEERSFEEPGIYLADDTFFKTFTHKFKAGDRETSLDSPGSVVITEDTAQRLFGKEDPLGKTLIFAPVGKLNVTGVISNVPHNSHFSFNYMISFNSLNKVQRKGIEQWLSMQGWAYLVLQKGADPRKVQKKFSAIYEKHTGKKAREYGIAFAFFLQKMTDIHLRSNLEYEIDANGNILYVYVFSAIALFILVIACINFMNLSTARSANRAREVGLRKVFGAHRQNLVRQFLSESNLLALAGLVLALALASMALPVFNNFTGKELTSSSLYQAPILIGMVFLVLFAGILAGSYPALFLSGFQPISVLRGRLSRGVKSSGLRKILVVFQFAISIILIIGTGIVIDQINFMKNKNLGFDKEQLLVALVQTQRTGRNSQSIKSELLQNPNITKATFSSSVPCQIGEGRLMIPEGRSKEETFPVSVMRCDYDFIETFGMKLAAGRNFSKDFATDAKEAYIINETAAKKFGWEADEALGKKLTFAEGRPGKIIGVTKDFHFQPLQQAIDPLALMVDKQIVAFATMKISTNNVSETINYVKKIWEAKEPGREFDYFFMDEDFAARYASEKRLSGILTSFAVLAIFIACLGLFGLASFTAEQRTKEIGIRKVLGASVHNIVTHLSRDFIKWVLVANILAWPAAYLVMRNLWLSNFAYRTTPSLFTFLIAGMASIFIALLTVSFQVIRAAVSNPADSLRHE